MLLFSAQISVFSQNLKLFPPEKGMYFGAFPDMGDSEDSVTADRINNFKSLVSNPPVWIYFSNNWFKGIKFPMESVKIISELGYIPYIRMMPRSDFTCCRSDPVYKLKKFLKGDFDSDLKKWAVDAKNFGKPLIVEFGTEVNGDWFPWSAIYNQNPKPVDGSILFADVYRHIINICKTEGANNITWVFHVNYDSSPQKKWNKMKNYYPGDEYIDWIGVSIYGAQKPGDSWVSFSKILSQCYSELCGISDTKPIGVMEFGAIEDYNGLKVEWLDNAFLCLTLGKYPRIKAISYWHSRWTNENGSISNMRLDSSPEVLNVFNELINNNFFKPQIIFK
jgi:hypothetical protein